MESTRSVWNAKTPVRVFVVSQSVQALFFPYSSQRGVFIRESRRELCGVGTRGTMVTELRRRATRETALIWYPNSDYLSTV